MGPPPHLASHRLHAAPVLSPSRTQALEAVREQLFLRLYKELPYAARLRLVSCLPLPDGSGGRRAASAALRRAPAWARSLPTGTRISVNRPTLRRPPPSPPSAVRIEVDVLVAAESTKRIVIGAGGAQVAAISRAACMELEAAWGHPVQLSLRVQVDKA